MAQHPALRSVWPYVAFTSFVFGGGGLLTKALVDDGVDPFTASWAPFVVGGTIALIVSLARQELRRDALGPAAFLGVVAVGAPAMLFNYGFDALPAGLVTLLISLGPVFTALGAHAVFPDERFNSIKFGGLVAAIVGVGILAAGSLTGERSGAPIVITLIGSVTAGLSGVANRKITMRFGVAPLMAPQLLTGAALALLMSRLLGRPIAPPQGFRAWHIVALAGFGAVHYIAVISLLRANERGTTGQVSVIGYFIPLIGVAGGIALFDERITFSLLLGGVLIVASMAAIAAGSRTAAAAATPTPAPAGVF